MGHYIGLDVASEVTAAAVLTEHGRVLFETKLPTSANNLKQLVKSVKRPRMVILEECCEAKWLYSVLEPLCDDVFVCNPKKNNDLSGHSKSDESDAYNLADRGRGGYLSRVWHGGKQFQVLRERLRLYESLTQESTALKNKIKAVFRSRGIQCGKTAYDGDSRTKAVKLLPLSAHRDRVLRLGAVLDLVTEQRDASLKELIKAVKKDSAFKSLTSIPRIGDIRAAMIVAEVGTPNRFRTRQQFWSYVGLAVTTYETGQYTVDDLGRVRAKERKVRTQGLVRQYNRTLKCVFKEAALQLSRFEWKDEFERLTKSGVKDSSARLTLARKVAAISLRLMKTGELYDEALVFAQKQISPQS